MIELNHDLQTALDEADGPLGVVDPRTGEEYLLIRREAYEKLNGMLRPFQRGWDDPELDVYEQYRKKP